MAMCDIVNWEEGDKNGEFRVLNSRQITNLGFIKRNAIF
jgi:hypothetical protein